MHDFTCRCFALTMAAILGSSSVVSAEEALTYERDIRPIPTPLTQIPKVHDAFRWPGVVACLTSKTISDFIRTDQCWEAYGTQSQFLQLADAQGKHLIVDHISRLEDLGKDWPSICQKIGITEPLPHANKSKRQYKDWRKYFSLDDINFLKEHYRADLEQFNYSV